jgi:hypothetical protein
LKSVIKASACAVAVSNIMLSAAAKPQRFSVSLIESFSLKIFISQKSTLKKW